MYQNRKITFDYDELVTFIKNEKFLDNKPLMVNNHPDNSNKNSNSDDDEVENKNNNSDEDDESKNNFLLNDNDTSEEENNTNIIRSNNFFNSQNEINVSLFESDLISSNRPYKKTTKSKLNKYSNVSLTIQFIRRFLPLRVKICNINKPQAQ